MGNEQTMVSEKYTELLMNRMRCFKDQANNHSINNYSEVKGYSDINYSIWKIKT